MTFPSVMQDILDLARWAPSGDNTQPWRFEILDHRRCVIHGFDTRDHCVYDLDGRPSQISLGALIETITIAASNHGLRVDIARRVAMPETTPTFDLVLMDEPGLPRDPLIDMVKARTVQRRAMSAADIKPAHKGALEASVGPRFMVHWLDGPGQKWAVAKQLFANAKVRLTMPEAFEVHRNIIQWGATQSTDRIPDAALGADRMTTSLMRILMKDWRRVDFANRFLAGTWAPRLQMDLLPALACGAHFVLVDSQRPISVDDHVAAGRAVQRLWLTAAALGIQQQPEMTPLIFESYVRRGIAFTRDAAVMTLARRLAQRFRQVFQTDPEAAVWMGRLGYGSPATARSVRRPLAELMVGGG